MTEQWQELKETITEMRDNDGKGTQQDACKFLANYMEVLEKQMQQPCEDAVSRTLVHEAITASIAESENPYEMWQRIEALPSVTPQRPKGKWIEVLEHKDEFSSTWHYECSECKGRSYKGFEPLEKYCPNCGAEMSGGETDADSD